MKHKLLWTEHPHFPHTSRSKPIKSQSFMTNIVQFLNRTPPLFCMSVFKPITANHLSQILYTFWTPAFLYISVQADKSCSSQVLCTFWTWLALVQPCVHVHISVHMFTWKYWAYSKPQFLVPFLQPLWLLATLLKWNYLFLWASVCWNHSQI